MKYLTLGAVITVLSFNLLAGHHEEPEGISGLVSSDVFDLAGEMDLYVEKYQNLVLLSRSLIELRFQS